MGLYLCGVLRQNVRPIVPPELALLTTSRLASASEGTAGPMILRIKIDDTNPDQRPRQEFTFSSGDYGPYPDPAAGTPIVSEFYGDYSWFFTITPLGDYCTWNGTVNIPKPLEDFESYEVSTVICYKRNLVFDTAATIPQERPVDIANGFSGISGAGASDIPLVVPRYVFRFRQSPRIP